ncbi:hypothetical protein COOONC_26568 [Cooperia oncophora]
MLSIHVPPLNKGRSTSPTKKEELRRKARQMLENPAAAAFPTGTSQDDEKRRQEARRLIEEAVTDGATYLVGSAEASTSSSNLQRSAYRSHTSINGSNSDLRKIGQEFSLSKTTNRHLFGPV